MSGECQWGVVIVNYNSARFALDAALSVLGDHPSAKVVIVDNQSTNNSMDIFHDAIEKKNHVSQALNNPISEVKIISAELRNVDAMVAGHGALPEVLPSLTIVEAGANGGFAAGSNVGLRTLEAEGDCTHYLLLNPDTQMGTGALEAFERALAAPDAGLCGATVLLANDPGKVQAFGLSLIHI